MVSRRILAALGACCALFGSVSVQAQSRSLESDVLTEINFARQHPREYAQDLREYRRYFEGRLLYLPGDDNGIITNEGTRAVDEAIAFLERQAPLPPLGHGALLALAAGDHAAAQGPQGSIGHSSRAGNSPGERVRRRGGDIYVGEGISYGYSSAQEVVRQLIVDDGVPGRGHRALLFDRGFRYAGVGCGGHRAYRHMCVVDMSGTPDGTPVLPQSAGARSGRAVRASGAGR
ncbi:MAG: CAP domain-containing protein [Sphingomonas sp.]|uniref:CAP domain-containing protein n=1 Tax=Sphingomonas sp. TaxID=28214 RepID=UPI001B24EB6B|nr:CAP domain-containing protein [Sphingomonas sp.]MBO9623308.1 CAP domain-containing protein [Sphingomonas sp.]